MGKTRILVVEDESIVAMEIRARLQNLGYVVTDVVSTGEEAIGQTAATGPDLVLMDIQLKGQMDGVQSAEQIRQRHRVPVVYLTAYADESTLQRAKLTEPFGYIIKPFEERELYKTIEMAVSKHKIEMKLKEREQWLDTTLRSIGDAVIATDREARVTFMNPVAEKLTGWRQDEALGTTLSEVFQIIDEKTRAVVENPVVRVLIEGKVSGLANHTALLSKDGKEIPIDDSAAPIRDEDGNIIGVVLVFRDISQRKQAEEALRDERSKAQKYLDVAGVMFVVLDAQGRVKHINRRGCEILRCAESEIVGREWFSEVIPPRARDEVKAVFQGLLGGESKAYEYIEGLVTSKDGKEHYIAWHNTILRDERDRVVGTLSSGEDITDRRQAADELRRQKALLDEVFNGIQEGIGIVDLAEKITFCNPAFAAILEKKVEDIVGKNLYEIFSMETHETIRQQREMRRRGEVSTYDLPFTTAGGKCKQIRITASPRFSKDGTYCGAFGAIVDITDRKLAEENLERKARQQDQLLQTARHLTESLDVEQVLTRIGTGAREILKAQGCSLYILEEDGDTLRPVVAIDPKYEKEILATPLKMNNSFTGKAVQARRGMIFNNPQSEGSGKQIPGTPVEYDEKLIVAPLIVDEKVLGAMCLDRMKTPFTQEDLALAETFATYASTALKNAQTHDDLQSEVHQRRQMEGKLKQALAELKRSNEELQQFAYVASHDLQEPLRMVASYVQLLAKRYGNKLDADADEFINYAVDGATCMQGLINDLLSYSRVGTRGRPFEMTNLEDVFLRAVANLQAAVVETGARVEHEQLPTILVDRVQFTQLFQNLVGNAIKFHNQKPPHIQVSAHQRDGEWIFSVRDNGIGIASEYRERIFMIFQRLHSHTEYQGTGIGLAICKRIVERHGGRIWVESQPGEGSTFYFTVPQKGEESHDLGDDVTEH